MADKYRILNTEPGVFYAQRSAGWTSLWGWETLRPFSGYEASFASEAHARRRIETAMTDAERVKHYAAARKVLLRGYPKVIPYRP